MSINWTDLNSEDGLCHQVCDYAHQRKGGFLVLFKGEESIPLGQGEGGVNYAVKCKRRSRHRPSVLAFSATL
jgi:hypothetical protein